MSLIKSIMHQLGLSVTPANNFTLDASADNGTMKLARGNAGATTQDIMTVDAAGKVTFPAVIPQAPGLIIDNGAADGGNLTLKSQGFTDWGADNSNGVLRLINVDIPGALGMTIDAAGKVVFPAMDQVLAGIGSITLPGGLILKWGNANSSAGSLTVTFATAFPNGIFQAFGICAVTANIVCVVQSQSASNAVFLSHIGSTGAGAATPIRWFAIGY